MKSRKTVLYVVVGLVVIIACVIATLLFSGRSISDLTGHQIYVKDVVTGEPIPNVTLGFTFADYCYPEDLLRGNYDHTTCEGRYLPIEPVATDENGLITFNISLTKHPPAKAVRYYVTESEGYHPTRSYGLTYHDTVWLVPFDSPLESKAAAIDWLDTQDSMQEIFEFYKSRNIEWEYLYAEEEAWYGVWRVTLNLSGDTIRNKAITVLVHPNASEYIICNSERERLNGTTPERFAELNQESDFIASLPESHEYKFGTEGCSSDLLLEE